MMSVPAGMPTALKRAVAVSVLAHIILLVLIVAAPDLPLAPRKRNITYVSLLGFGGGGPGGGSGGPAGGAAAPAPAPARKEMLRDLTVASKVKPQPPPASFTHPVDKPKTGKTAPEKKAAISGPQPNVLPNAPEAAPTSAAGVGGGGSGVRIGVGPAGGGSGPGGGGSGGGFGGGGGGFGAGNFPYTYYIQGIIDRVSSSWFTSLVDPGVAGSFQTTVYFKILRNGQIADLKVEAPSGISSLDLSALRAVQSAAPFPPLPSEYEDQFLLIHLVFEHTK